MAKYRNKTLEGKRKEFAKFLRKGAINPNGTDDEVIHELRCCPECGEEFYSVEKENWAILEFDSPAKTLEIIDEYLEIYEVEHQSVEDKIISVIGGTICSFLLAEAVYEICSKNKNNEFFKLIYEDVRLQTGSIFDRYSKVKNWYKTARPGQTKQLQSVIKSMAMDCKIDPKEIVYLIKEIHMSAIFEKEFDKVYSVLMDTLTEPFEQ